jgi:hypothetical protein
MNKTKYGTMKLGLGVNIEKFWLEINQGLKVSSARHTVLVAAWAHFVLLDEEIPTHALQYWLC